MRDRISRQGDLHLLSGNLVMDGHKNKAYSNVDVGGGGFSRICLSSTSKRADDGLMVAGRSGWTCVPGGWQDDKRSTRIWRWRADRHTGNLSGHLGFAMLVTDGIFPGGIVCGRITNGS